MAIDDWARIAEGWEKMQKECEIEKIKIALQVGDRDTARTLLNQLVEKKKEKEDIDKMMKIISPEEKEDQ